MSNQAGWERWGGGVPGCDGVIWLQEEQRVPVCQ